MEVNEILAHETDVLSLEVEMQQKVRERVGRVQRDMVLREQMKVLQHELGEDGDEEIEEYTHRVHALRVDDEIRKSSCARWTVSPSSPTAAPRRPSSATISMSVWRFRGASARVTAQTSRRRARSSTATTSACRRSRSVFWSSSLCARSARSRRGKILCLVGPPGVGKTSIALSVAKAMNRRLYRLSLGGVRDEADIRGHRKTYIGAMPGRIIDGIVHSGSMNPLLVLDEIDKLASDMRGDPASALLEVLDSEQNRAFRDHFLEIPVDLSQVMFITTANTTDTIPRPLLDRMEVIRLTSYTDEEKLQIAKNHLLPKQLKEHGLRKPQLRISDEALRAVIAGYTRESGVRQLERLLGKLCRKTAMALVTTDVKSLTVTPGGCMICSARRGMRTRYIARTTRSAW